MTFAQLLVVEDDAAVRRGLVDTLESAGYAVRTAADGPAGLAAALAGPCDLVLLDVMLPGADGFSVLQSLRRDRPLLPVILLTARGAESDRVRGLRGGADDYVVKPFGAAELLARVETVLRRVARQPRKAAVLSIAGRTVDFDRREVRFEDGAVQSLTEREAALLQFLHQHPGRAITREELLREVWQLDPRGLVTRTVDMAVARVREQLRDDPTAPRIVLTVRSRGYMLGPFDGQPHADGAVSEA
mgnify:CR=1 FL=1